MFKIFCKVRWMPETGKDIYKDRKFKDIICRMANCNSPWPILLQVFWLIKFRSLHGQSRLQLQQCLGNSFAPI